MLNLKSFTKEFEVVVAAKAVVTAKVVALERELLIGNLLV